MAATMKRQHDQEEEDEITKKKVMPDASDSQKSSDRLRTFMKWCENHDFNISPKVRVGLEGSCDHYGMVALEDIADGYCLFQVPRSCLLQPENCEIADIIEKDKSKLAATNQWVPLLVSLLHEQNNPSSLWKPYLDLVPDFECLDLPMFWDRSDLESLLKGTGVDKAVERDLKMIEDDYNKLVIPFFQNHSSKTGNNARDIDFFKKMVAFVMAYSFTEPQTRKSRSSENGNNDEESDDDDDDDDDDEPAMSPPKMVPMADMLNHITKNNAKLTFGNEALKMVTTRAIKKGEEIYNTYGQVSNLHLMHMYGFSEPFPDNTNDVVEIPVQRLLEAAKEMKEKDSNFDNDFVDEKWEVLMEQDVVAEDDIFVLGMEGIITDDICSQVIKVLSMSKSEFADYVEQEGWSDAESDSSLSGESKFSLAKIPYLNPKWKQLLSRMGELHLSNYSTTLTQDEEKLKLAQSLRRREKYALFTAHGQKMLIKQLCDACSSNK